MTAARKDPVLANEFDFFRATIRRLSGITLSEAKKDLLVARLRSRVQELKLTGLGQYRDHIAGLPPEHPEWQVFINLLTTNKTDWFREPSHFEYLVNEILPSWKVRRLNKPSIWSAASSTGEEAYTTAMVLKKALGSSAAFEILGTDIDTEVLATAQRGVYYRHRLSQVPEEYRAFFSLGTEEIAEWMRVKGELKQHVSFGQLNLLHEIPAEGRFDLIFCRNVLIYFSRETIKQVTDHLYEAAAPGATLFIGHSESLQNIQTNWRLVKPSIFVKR